MADKPPQGSPGNEGPEPVPGGSLRSPVTVPGWGLALLLASAMATGVFIIYLARGSGPLHHAGHLSGSNGTLTSSAGAPPTSPTVTSAPDPSGSRPRAGSDSDGRGVPVGVSGAGERAGVGQRSFHSVPGRRPGARGFWGLAQPERVVRRSQSYRRRQPAQPATRQPRMGMRRLGGASANADQYPGGIISVGQPGCGGRCAGSDSDGRGVPVGVSGAGERAGVGQRSFHSVPGGGRAGARGFWGLAQPERVVRRSQSYRRRQPAQPATRQPRMGMRTMRFPSGLEAHRGRRRRTPRLTAAGETICRGGGR